MNYYKKWRVIMICTIKKIMLSGLMIACVSQSSIMNAHPLEKLMPFISTLWKSENFLSSIQGLWIKKLAEPYGLNCPYPVLVKREKYPATYAAYAASDDPKTSAQPKLDKLGRVILDIADKDLVKTTNQHIVFNYNTVRKNLHNPKYLTAVLFHEMKHLDENHRSKTYNLYKQSHYADQNGLGMALSNGIQVNQNQVSKVLLPGLGILCEEEADSAIKAYPDLCRAKHLYTRSRCFKRDLKKFRTETYVWVEIDKNELVGMMKNTGSIRDKKVFELYRKACLGDQDAYEYLEQKYKLSHPLSIRRHQYYLAWADEAEKNQIKKHPNLNDAWLDYCTRHITKSNQKQ